jgi:integrase
MRWHELDLAEGLWTIPPERYKSDKEHLVPLPDSVVALLQDMRDKRPQPVGQFVFTTTGGVKAIAGFGKVKRELDARLATVLGRDVDPFVNHDLRRTVRTRLSQLRVRTEVAELVIGHTLKGLHATYDQHAFLDERREALQAWDNFLRSVVAPVPANVVKIAADRAQQ